MSTVHMTRLQGWQLCTLDEAVCPEIGHVPDMDVATASALPQAFLEALLGHLTPAGEQRFMHSALVSRTSGKHTVNNQPVLAWFDEQGRRHRDYGLPAIIWLNSGRREWYQHGDMRRPNGLPCYVRGETA